jgi:hypothetical protein
VILLLGVCVGYVLDSQQRIRRVQREVTQLNQTAQGLEAFTMQRLEALTTQMGSLRAAQEQILESSQHLEKMLRESFVSRDFVSTAGMLDRIPIYQKGGVVEIFGATLRQRHAGPIKISHSIITVVDDLAAVLWYPDGFQAPSASHLLIRFEGSIPDKGVLQLGVSLPGGKTYLFEIVLGPTLPSPKDPKPVYIPAHITKEINAGGTPFELQRVLPNVFIAALPGELAAAVRQRAAKSIESMFIVMKGAAGSVVQIQDFGFVREGERMADTVELGGQVVGAQLPPGSSITLLTEKGERQTQILSIDNRFLFSGLRSNEPMSVRLRYAEQDYYPNFSRWIASETNLKSLLIDVRPLFRNAEGKPPDPKRVQLTGALSPTDFAGTYEPHTEQIWPGAGPIQEYDSTTFANNHGFIDRDRSFENPDKCFRIGSIGSSLAVALQVRIGQKYNIIMESDLAVRLGRCVEVISAGRDNGDVGSNYRNIKNYAAMFKPDIIMLENGNSLMMQMQPDLLRLMLGWSHEYNAIDNFYYNDGKLAFRRSSPEYPLHTASTKLDAIEGIPLSQVLMVPSAVMPSVGKDAYRYFEDIMKFIMVEFRTSQFVVHTGLDQVTCSKSGSCASELKLEDGRTVLAGYRVFAQNLLEACRRATATCVDPIIYEGLNTKKTPLSWTYDAHYNPRGHQWMAEQLISLLEHRLGLSNPN